MIWSSRARNRSPDFVASCFFGRIARHSLGEQAPENHGFRFEGIKETSLQASRAADPKTLQSRTSRGAEKRISINDLAVVHGRRINPAAASASVHRAG